MLFLLYIVTVLLSCTEGLTIRKDASNASPSANDTAQALVVSLSALFDLSRHADNTSTATHRLSTYRHSFR